MIASRFLWCGTQSIWAVLVAYPKFTRDIMIVPMNIQFATIGNVWSLKEIRWCYIFTILECFQLNWVRQCFFFSLLLFLSQQLLNIGLSQRIFDCFLIIHVADWIAFNFQTGWSRMVKKKLWILPTEFALLLTGKLSEDEKGEEEEGRHIHIIKLIVSFELFFELGSPLNIWIFENMEKMILWLGNFVSGNVVAFLRIVAHWLELGLCMCLFFVCIDGNK